MGTAKKVKKDIGGSKGASIGGKLAAATGLGGVTTAAAAGSIKEVGDALESGTGLKARRHAEANRKRKEAEAAAAGTRISSSAEATKVSAQGQKDKLAERSRDIDVAQSERIARGDVRDVTTGPIESASIAQAPQEQFRQAQQTLGTQLAATAAGQGVTPAQLQLKQATERNIAQQAALRAGTSGAGAALARREIGRTGAQLGQQAAQQGALLRAQETTAAQQQLGQLAGAARGQDIGLATSQAGLEQQSILQAADQDLKAQLANQGVDLNVLKDNAARGDTVSLANMQSQLKQLGMNDAMIQAYMAQELGATGIQANIATGQASAIAAANASARQAQAARDAAVIGGIGSLGAAGIAASDVNLKTNIKDGKKSIGEFLKSLSAYDYDYKDKKFGKGKHNSVMAQDLEKTETGKKAVMDTDEGKMVDYASLLPSMLSGLAETHREVMDLKEALKKKERK